jgi:glycosyltransferase involved in cell wall biosynthesis
MRIAVDARWIFPQISGIGAYTVQLLENLAALDDCNDYLAVFRDSALLERTFAAPSLARSPRFRACLVPYGLFAPRNQWALPRLLKRERIDLYHAPNYMMPLFPAVCGARHVRCVTTIHDVIPLAFPHHAPQSMKSRLFPLYRLLMRQVARRADAVLTVSQSSKRDIEHYLRVPARRREKIRVVYNGVSEQFRPRSVERSPAKTILYVGRQDPYKNLCGLIEIFAKVRRRIRGPLRLVIAGADDPRYPESARRAAELDVERDILRTGYLTPEQLVDAYAQADVLAHPSFYEGFGLQVLEAMACGLPVVCSQRSSLPEVAGEAALLVDPDDHEAFAAAIERVLTRPAVAHDLIGRGLEQAARFHWNKTARETLRVYEEVYGRKTRLDL